jgi:hypothetical protein
VLVKYRISEELRRKLFVESGQDEGLVREVNVDLDTQELRRASVIVFGGIKDEDWLGGCYEKIEGSYVGPDGDNYLFETKRLPNQDKLLSDAEIKAKIIELALGFEAALEQAKDEAFRVRVEFDEKMKSAQKIIDRIDALEEAGDVEGLKRSAFDMPEKLKDFVPMLPNVYPRDSLNNLRHAALKRASNEIEEAQREADKAQRKAEKDRWIKARGSDHLKRAFEGGYEVGRLYTLERVADEFPEWDIDFADTSDWKDRKNPSLAELDAVAVAEAKTGRSVIVVWLIKPPMIDSEEDEYDPAFYEFEQQAALVIRGFLGKYDLVKSL